jgi:thermitase
MKTMQFKSGLGLALLAGVAATFPTSSLAAPGAADPQGFARGRILVEPRAGLSDQEFDQILKVHGGKRRRIGQSNLHIVELPGNASETAVVERLRHNPHLRFAELDLRVKSTLAVNDPYLGSQWHLAQVGAAGAWDTTQGAGVTIAILDSGVDAAHPDLAPNMTSGFNVIDNNSDTSDVCGHGTAVAGTASAATNNSVGVAGMAGQARIMPIRIAYFDTASNGCYSYYSTIASGLTYAADHGARVANVSYARVASSDAAISAARYMKDKGGLVFVSAGNNGIDENLLPTTAMVVVAATDSGDARTSWSSYGSFVSLSAPGAGIWTTSRGGGYQGWNGTSFSSPLAAGVAALMMAANPALGSTQVEQLLYSSAVDLGAAGRDPLYGFGRVDAAAAVRAAAGAVVVADTEAPAVSIGAPGASSSVSGVVAVDVSATDNVGVTRVELQVNGTVVAVASAAPYGFSWNSTGVANGMATLVAVAYDAAGNMANSAPVSVNVANAAPPVVRDTSAPVVAINSPVAGMVTGNVSVNVSATDDSGAAGISQSLYIDGVLKAKGSGGTLGYNWNTRKGSAGTHTIQAVARDAAGNTSTSSVTVSTR